MRTALAQISSGQDPGANLDLIASCTAAAAERGVDLVVFPEAAMRCFGGSLSEVAEPLDGPWSKALAEIARRHEVVVAAGMFTPASNGRVANTVRIVGRGLDTSYDKIHLFDAFGFCESDTVAAGTTPRVVQISGVAVGFATCYDVRFPGLFTALADRGAQVICLPASWGAGPGKLEQWRLLVRARALDSTSFVAAAAQADPASVGASTGGRAPTGIGHSLAASPLGEVIAELGAEPDLLLVDLDPALVARAREALPVLLNRRF
jgi:predicted amidohydrolase